MPGSFELYTSDLLKWAAISKFQSMWDISAGGSQPAQK